MSTTSKKDDKELTRDVTTLETAISNLSYSDLLKLANDKKASEIESVQHKLKEAKGIVDSLEAQLINLGVGSTAPVKRGRKPNAFNPLKPAKVAKKGKTASKGKRGAVGEAIAEVVAKAGKKGIHVTDIAKATGFEVPNVTAFFYAKANKPKYKNLGKATWAAK